MGTPFGLHDTAISSMSVREMMLERHHEPVLEVLRSRPGEELTARHVYDALDRDIPRHTVALVLSELVHRGLVSRRSEPGQGRRRGTSYFRVVGES